MQSKVDIVRSWLSESFGGAAVSYKNVDMLHKFRLETSPMRWLYVSHEFLSDQPEADILTAVHDFGVVRHLTGKAGPVHLMLTHTGLIEVDADFGRGAHD
jgi:hypothetical protein